MSVQLHRRHQLPPVLSGFEAINRYWDVIGGSRMLPGTLNAPDRFVRASYFLKSAPEFEDRDMATAAVFGIMRAIGVPFVVVDPDHPEISATLWRTVSDHDKRRYYFESALQPAICWVDLDSIDFSEGANIVGVATGRPEPLAGEISSELKAMARVQWI